MNSKKLTFEDLPDAIQRLQGQVDRLSDLIVSMAEKVNDIHYKAKDDLLSVEEAAEFLDLAKPTIYSKVSRGELPYLKNGNRVYFSKAKLISHLKEGGRKSHAEIASEADNYLKGKGNSR